MNAMNPTVFELSLEQKFSLQVAEAQTRGLSRDEIIERLLKTMTDIMVTDNLIRDWIKNNGGGNA